jgi:hypothetical protein
MIFPVKPEVIGYVPMIFHENVHLSKILPCFFHENRRCSIATFDYRRLPVAWSPDQLLYMLKRLEKLSY